MLRYLLVFMLLAGAATAGTNILDANGNVVFTDVSSLNQSLVASGNAVTLTLRGQATAHVQVTANTTTLQFEGSVDGTNFFSENAIAEITGALVTSTTGTGSWYIDTAGLTNFRVRQSAAGAATVSVVASQGESSVSLSNPLPVGTNLIGAVNTQQFGGSVVVTGTGAGGAGIPRVTISNDSSLAANQSVNVAQIGGTNTVTAAAGVQKVGVIGNANAAFDAATGAAPPANALLIAGLTSGATGGFMKAITVCDTYVNVNIVTATTVLLVTGVSGRHVRICAIALSATGADTFNLLSGTGATCGTGTTGMLGGTTAATGASLAANGQFLIGDGLGQINQTNATGDSVCIITGAAVQISGRIAYTIF